MNQTFARRVGATAAVVGISALVAGAGSAPAGVSGAPGAVITGKRVGAVKVGASYTSLRKKNLVGRIRHGCERRSAIIAGSRVSWARPTAAWRSVRRQLKPTAL